MTESTSTAGFFYNRTVGTLGPGDLEDNFAMISADVDGLGGKLLSVEIQAEGVGSLLDPMLTVYDGDTDEVLVELEVDPDGLAADPRLLDFEIPGDPGSVIIMFEAEDTGAVTESNFYMFIAYVSEK